MSQEPSWWMTFRSSNSWNATGTLPRPRRNGNRERIWTPQSHVTGLCYLLAPRRKLKGEPPEQRAVRPHKQDEDNTSLIQEVPKAFDFQLVGEDVVNDRRAYILQATPHPGYQAQGKYGKMFSKVAGKLWVDKQDLGWIKVEGQVIQPFSLGLFLVRLLPGSRINMEQTRVDNGIWMPERVEVRAAAKIFLVKSLIIERVLIYSEYQRPQAR